MISPHGTEHPPRYSRYPPTFIMISPHGTEHPPRYSRYPPRYSWYPPRYWTPPTVLSTPHGTAHTLYRVIHVAFSQILCGRNFCVWQVTKWKFTGQLQMASLSLYPQFETNLMSNRNVIELLLQLKSEKAHGKNFMKVKTHLVRHLLRGRALWDTRP